MRRLAPETRGGPCTSEWLTMPIVAGSSGGASRHWSFLPVLASKFIYGFAKDFNSFPQCFLCYCERRRNFYGLPPRTNGREEEQTFVKTTLDDRMGEIVIRLFGSGFHDL